jgi:hypothetical protein
MKKRGGRPRDVEREKADREYFAMRAAAEEYRRRRVRHTATVNPDLSWDLIGERHGIDPRRAQKLAHDIPRERDGFATAVCRQNHFGLAVARVRKRAAND